jgi:hypothetical protein
VDLYASGMLPSPRVLQAPPYQPRRISLLQPRRRAGDEQRARKEAEEEILKGYYGHRRHTQMTPSQQIRTFEETEERKKVKKEEEDKLKYAVRRGKHLFVKRGGAQYVDALTEGITITEAAVRIQSAYRCVWAKEVAASNVDKATFKMFPPSLTPYLLAAPPDRARPGRSSLRRSSRTPSPFGASPSRPAAAP